MASGFVPIETYPGFSKSIFIASSSLSRLSTETKKFRSSTTAESSSPRRSSKAIASPKSKTTSSLSPSDFSCRLVAGSAFTLGLRRITGPSSSAKNSETWPSVLSSTCDGYRNFRPSKSVLNTKPKSPLEPIRLGATRAGSGFTSSFSIATANSSAMASYFSSITR